MQKKNTLLKIAIVLLTWPVAVLSEAPPEFEKMYLPDTVKRPGGLGDYDNYLLLLKNNRFQFRYNVCGSIGLLTGAYKETPETLTLTAEKNPFVKEFFSGVITFKISGENLVADPPVKLDCAGGTAVMKRFHFP